MSSQIGPRARRTARGFSLIEVVLAVAVISFALVGILGLFPVAIEAARTSQDETRAAFIARQIFSQIEAECDRIKRLDFTTRAGGQPQDGAAGDARAIRLVPAMTRPSIDLGAAGAAYLAYDEQGKFTGAATVTDFSSPARSNEQLYIAKVQVTPDTPNDGLSRLDVTITLPGTRNDPTRFATLFEEPSAPPTSR